MKLIAHVIDGHQVGAGWQKLYYRGLDPEAKAAVEEHRTRLRLKPFKRPGS